MKIYDISWPLSQKSTEYKNKDSIFFSQLKDFELDQVRESKICMSTHTGTHVDAPAHFLKEGDHIHQIGLDRCIGTAHVLDLMHVREKITAEHLDSCTVNEHDIVLLKTANSNLPFDADFESEFVYLDPSGAEYLASKRVKAVAIDYLGIERNDPDHRTHKTLFHAGVVIIEGVRLAHVDAGNYFMICLPLALVGLEAAPARAVLMSQ